MAVLTTRVDDIDGSTDEVETVKLSLADRTVEIDLSKINLDKLHKTLAPYFEHGREVTRKPQGNSDTAVMRDWLNSNGHPVGAKGRVPEELQAIYRSAHPAA